MCSYRAAKASNSLIFYNTYYLMFTYIYNKSSWMLLKQEFASSSFYYSISHEFFIAQAFDPASTYTSEKTPSWGACSIQQDWVFVAQQTPGTRCIYRDFQLFGDLRIPSYDS